MGNGEVTLQGGSDGPSNAGRLGPMAGATAGLVEVSGEVRRMRDSIASGGLRMDAEAAHKLLASLADTQAGVQRMIVRASSDLDQRLRLGDNPIGHTMSERFRGAASGGRRAARPVLEDFAKLLEELEQTVRKAAGLYVAADDDAVDRLGKAAHGDDARPSEREGWR